MRIRNRDRSNFARFGCSFVGPQNLILIPWQLDPQKVSISPIQARFIHGEWPSGPLVCVAFEISFTKALAHYCFFPFTLKDETHTRYFSTVLKQRSIRLSFLTESGRISRIYELPSSQHAYMAEALPRLITDAQPFPENKYEYERAVSEFEQSIRLVDVFQYVLTHSEFRRVAALFKDEAAKVPVEDRADAVRIANELIGAFRPHYEGFVRPGMKKLPTFRRNLLALLDLHREFENDYDGFVQFVSDAIAAHTPKEENRQLQTATLLFQSIFRLMSDFTASARNEEVSSDQVQADFKDLMTRLVGGQGLSIKALTNLLSGIGVPLGGRPGRTPKDYSNEYALKAARRPWSAVARYTLESDPETRQEFGGRKYAALTFEEKETLKHRVREGVRSYAKRVGKPFPPSQPEPTVLPPADREQEKSS